MVNLYVKGVSLKGKEHMTKSYTAHQLRALDELDALNQKIHDLSVFINTNETFIKLEQFDQALLRTQLDAMSAYARVLELRISRF